MVAKTAVAPAKGQPEPLKILGSSAETPKEERWVAVLRKVALGVFVGVPLFSWFLPRYAGRVVWTMVIAALPLFFVLAGYHRWRRICPLAFVAQLPAKLKIPGKAKAPAWLQHNYYYVCFSVFVVCLWLRLVATNGHGGALAIFFVALSVAALASGFLFTGKTWCNYFCPVLFVEKTYTEPRGLRETRNSQCLKCTACKSTCPDINEENGYWKEFESHPKQVALLSFPGVVFAFYFYYYLQAGSWGYYFGGAWTYQPGILYSAFHRGYDRATAGLFFAPATPRAVAALLALLAGGVVSYGIFSLVRAALRRWLPPGDDGERVTHLLLTTAASSAFVIFYTFAGAPTLERIPGATHWFGVLVIFAATFALLRRWPRTRKAFAEESLARNIVKRWNWPDLPAPADLHEAFLVHTIRLRESARGYEQLLNTYTAAVRETLASGFVSREDLYRMERLRDALGIKEQDYDDIIARLADEDRVRSRQIAQTDSVEKRLQYEGYMQALEQYLHDVLTAGGKPNEESLRELQAEYLVSKEEHLALLDQVYLNIRSTEAGVALLRNWHPAT